MSTLFALTPDGDGLRWPIQTDWCSWNGLWGGAMLGVAVTALERAAGKPVCALNAQFVSPVGSEGSLLLKPELRVQGREVVQAAVDATVNGVLALSATAVMGALRGPAGASARPPEVPEPDACSPKQWLKPEVGGLRRTLETRIARQSPMAVAFWVRCTIAAELSLSTALIAAIVDKPAAATGVATAGRLYGLTLDSNLRVFEPRIDRPGDSWLLIDVRFDGMADNLAFATVNVWLEDRLLAICAQTLRLRSGTR